MILEFTEPVKRLSGELIAGIEMRKLMKAIEIKELIKDSGEDWMTLRESGQKIIVPFEDIDKFIEALQS